MNIYYVYIDNCITLLKFETFERNTYDNFETQESNAWEIFSIPRPYANKYVFENI